MGLIDEWNTWIIRDREGESRGCVFDRTTNARL
jgi:hypothetical protein